MIYVKSFVYVAKVPPKKVAMYLVKTHRSVENRMLVVYISPGDLEHGFYDFHFIYGMSSQPH